MISDRAKKIPTSAALAINAKCNALLKQGKNVIKFAIGESDFTAPENVNKAAIKAIEDEQCHYTAASGLPELKEAIRKKFERENKIHYKADEVMASSGGKGILWAALQVLVNPGDEVLTPNPYYLSYPPLISLCDGVMTTAIAKEEDEFEVKADAVEEAITNKTKVFLFCSPSNPTGSMISKNELKKIADVLVEHNIYCLSDEVYDNLVYEGEHCSIASLNDEIKQLTVTMNAASKTYSVSGWRIGYGGASKEIIDAMTALQSHEIGNPNTIAQYAVIEALNGPQDYVKKMRDEFLKRRNLVIKRLNEINGISCVMPKGAIYAFPNISRIFNDKIKNSTDFCNTLLDEELVGIIPGEPSGSEKHCRITYASSLKDINEGIDRIERFVKKIEGQ